MVAVLFPVRVSLTVSRDTPGQAQSPTFFGSDGIAAKGKAGPQQNANV
jgi:hypothetical protein